MTQRCDYLIVGGGLAGATLGYILKKAGKDVLIVELLDAAAKDKLCGGILLPQAMQLISQIFSRGGQAAFPVRKIDTLRLRFAGREILRNIKEIYTAERKIIDDFALRCYIAEGGRILDRTLIKEIDDISGTASAKKLLTGEQVTIEFSRLVGADGAFSAVRRMVAGEKQPIAAALEGKVPLVCPHIVFDKLAKAEAGYSWYIPYRDYAVVGCYLIPAEGKYPTSLREILGVFCEQLGLGLPAKLRGAPIPDGSNVRLVVGKRTYFVGDAAGLIQKTNGGGIEYALWSAKCLAEFFLGGEDYEKAMRDTVEVVARLARDARKIQFLSNIMILRLGHPQEPLSKLESRSVNLFGG